MTMNNIKHPLPSGTCHWCGREVDSNVIFCSYTCQKRWELRAQGLAPENRPKSTKKCPTCGKTLVHTPGKKKKTFCSDTCRGKWWREYRECKEPWGMPLYLFTCKACGKQFEAFGNPDRKYCSHDCYITYRYYNNIPLENENESHEN